MENRKKIKEDYEKKFQEKLDFLNDEQREAVETIEGPVVVVAGPGTGKTQILTLRIANILKKMGAEFAPNILALTFTNAGVHAMRKRLAEFIGTELAYQVGIFTFHSFAEEQIRNNPEVFKNFAFSRPITDIQKIEIIEEILEKGK
jgi:DNA helicase-2/ATP-dependent DNA helicase PcrA